MTKYTVYQTPMGHRIPSIVKNVTEQDAKWFCENNVKISQNDCLGFTSISGEIKGLNFDDDSCEVVVVKTDDMSFKKAYRELKLALQKELGQW